MHDEGWRRTQTWGVVKLLGTLYVGYHMFVYALALIENQP